MVSEEQKILISAYCDHEVSAAERQRVEQWLASSPEARQYLKSLQMLSAALHQWPAQSLSPDLEQKIQNGFSGKKKENTMNEQKVLRIAATMSVLVIVFVMAQQYTYKTIHGRVSVPEDQLTTSTQQSFSEVDSRPVVDDLKYQVPRKEEASVKKSLKKTEAIPARSSDSTGPLDNNRRLLASESGEKKDKSHFESLSDEERRANEKSGILLESGNSFPASAVTKNKQNEIDQLVRIDSPKEAYLGRGEREKLRDGHSFSSDGLWLNRSSREGSLLAANVSNGYQSLNQNKDLLGGKVACCFPPWPHPIEPPVYIPDPVPALPINTEQYDALAENSFLEVRSNPLSTFAVDVDTASYANIRRFINGGQLPPRDAVRIEEMINYFTYDYPQPEGKEPFSITTEVAVCPWNPKHDLLMIGLQGKSMAADHLPPGNLVFLIDVSGSMDEPNKLPLLKSAFRLLVNQMRPQDRVAIVTYAGAAGVALPVTSGAEKQKILAAIDALYAGGSTAGSEGIKVAYRLAQDNFLKEGNNRVILATDGDFNVGVSSDDELVRLIEEKRDAGIALSILGFGSGNYKDSKMEKLADKGNGNYAYIDNILEGQKVLVNQLGGTLLTIAKDVKIQIEFNPGKVKAYRLIGYENRKLAKEDFNDDTKDAGEIGSGHSVTALYEVVGADSDESFASVDALKYQEDPAKVEPMKVISSEDLVTIKLRYKEPNARQSQLLTRVVSSREKARESQSNNFKFATSVVEFGLLLKNSAYKGQSAYSTVLERARQSRGEDPQGYRAELIRLVESAALLDHQDASVYPQ